jgi:hypothetical protein
MELDISIEGLVLRNLLDHRTVGPPPLTQRQLRQHGKCRIQGDEVALSEHLVGFVRRKC